MKETSALPKPPFPDSSSIELKVTGLIERGDLIQLINRETSCWAYVDKMYLPFIEYLQKGVKTLSQICEHSDIPKSTIIEKINYFYESGILKIDNTSDCDVSSLCYKPEFKPYFALINVTDQCNFNCRYCYYKIEKNQKMPVSTIVKIACEMLSYPPISDMAKFICFHGGEPLLCFNEIRQAWEKIKTFDKENSLKFSLQTNGSFITDEMARFFKEAKFEVGISIDGPEQIHNYYRKFSNNKDSFFNVMHGIEILKKHDVVFGTITTLSRNNIFLTDEIIDFFISNNILQTAMISVFITNKHTKKDVQDFHISYKDLLIARKNIYKKITSVKDQVKFQERELSSIITNILTLNRQYMCGRSPCGAAYNILSFEPNGDIYPCDSLTGIKEFDLGNITVQGLPYILDKAMSMKRSIPISERKQCQECHYKYICRGYCMGQDYQSLYNYNSNLFDNGFCEYSYNLIEFFMNEIAENRLDAEYFM